MAPCCQEAISKILLMKSLTRNFCSINSICNFRHNAINSFTQSTVSALRKYCSSYSHYKSQNQRILHHALTLFAKVTDLKIIQYC